MRHTDFPHKGAIDINGGLGKRGASLGITDKGEACVFYLKYTSMVSDGTYTAPEVTMSINSAKIGLCDPNGLEDLKNELLKLI